MAPLSTYRSGIRYDGGRLFQWRSVPHKNFHAMHVDSRRLAERLLFTIREGYLSILDVVVQTSGHGRTIGDASTSLPT